MAQEQSGGAELTNETRSVLFSNVFYVLFLEVMSCDSWKPIELVGGSLAKKSCFILERRLVALEPVQTVVQWLYPT